MTGSPEVAVAVTSKSGSPKLRSASGAKSIELRASSFGVGGEARGHASRRRRRAVTVQVVPEAIVAVRSTSRSSSPPPGLAVKTTSLALRHSSQSSRRHSRSPPAKSSPFPCRCPTWSPSTCAGAAGGLLIEEVAVRDVEEDVADGLDLDPRRARRRPRGPSPAAEPSFGVEAASVVGNVWPPSVESDDLDVGRVDRRRRSCRRRPRSPSGSSPGSR